MKYLSFIVSFFLACTSAFASGSDTLDIKKITDLATQVQKKYAPDRRIEFFEVKVQGGEAHTYTVESTSEEAIASFNSLVQGAGIVATANSVHLPAADLNGLEYGLANLSVINNRYAPGHTGEMATQSLLGTPVKILKKAGGYYFVRTPDNYLSWTESAGIV